MRKCYIIILILTLFGCNLNSNKYNDVVLTTPKIVKDVCVLDSVLSINWKGLKIIKFDSSKVNATDSSFVQTIKDKKILLLPDRDKRLKKLKKQFGYGDKADVDFYAWLLSLTPESNGIDYLDQLLRLKLILLPIHTRDGIYHYQSPDLECQVFKFGYNTQHIVIKIFKSNNVYELITDGLTDIEISQIICVLIEE